MKLRKTLGLREQLALILLMLLFSATVSRSIVQLQKVVRKNDVVLFADGIEQEEDDLQEIIPFLLSESHFDIRFLQTSECGYTVSAETESAVLISKRWKVFCQLRLGGLIA